MTKIFGINLLHNEEREWGPSGLVSIENEIVFRKEWSLNHWNLKYLYAKEGKILLQTRLNDNWNWFSTQQLTRKYSKRKFPNKINKRLKNENLR